MQNIKRKLFRIVLIFLSIILIAAVTVFLFRNAILEEVISKAKLKFKTEYNSDFYVEKANFEGFSEIEMANISLVPVNADTLLSIGSIKTKINIYRLLSGRIQIEKLDLKNGYIQLVKNAQGKNFAAFLKSDSKKSNETDTKTDFAAVANRIIDKVLDLIPENIMLNNVTFRLDDLGKKLNLQIPKLILNNDNIQTKIFVTTNTFSQTWNVYGTANPRKKTADLFIKNTDTTKIRLPYIDEKFNLISSFDNMHLKVDKIEMDNGELHINGMTSVDNLTVNNPKIASKDVIFKKSQIDFKCLIGKRFLAIDTGSTIMLNDIKVHPYIEYNAENDVIYTLKANIDKMAAQNFINSLPTGLFGHFEGIVATGNFDYNIDIKYNKNKPWQLTFNSNLQKENLKIIKYGTANLEKLNSDFIYNAIEKGVLQRPIDISLKNPNYIPLDQISPYLQKCVLTSEDPSFFSHKGFVKEAFRQSILKNVKTNKFSRGASTISMQLVKNVFLTREKTISRKLEEILLVYILENNRIASKNRMLEVYFNIIEWAPDIYGIGEASQFYFSKKPIDLTLKECLFLASIIPSPKKFMNNFDAFGNLKPIAEKREEFIKNLMQKRGLITLDSTDSNNKLMITGNARKFMNIKTLDSITVDSLNIDGF